MKLELKKVIQVLSKIKQEDDFYFKNYAPEIIESYSDEIAEDFHCWCEENKGWIEKYSVRQKLLIFKKERNENINSRVNELFRN